MSEQATLNQEQGVKQGDGSQVPTPVTTPPGGEGEQSATTPQTTQELGNNPEVKKLIDATVETAVTAERKKLNDGFTDRGRELVRLQGVEGKLTKISAELDGYRTAANEAELTAARQNPDLMSVYQRKQLQNQRDATQDERESKLDEREGKLKTEEEGYERWKVDTNATEIAGRYGVEKDLLITIATGSNPEDMERLAKTLAEKGVKLETTPPEGEGEKKKTNVPESGIGAGGGALGGRAGLRAAIDKAKATPK